MTVLKEKERLESPRKHTWHPRRTQKYLIVATLIVIVVLCTLVFQSHQPGSTAEFHLGMRAGFQEYGSSPDAGRPAIPYNELADHKVDQEPFFDVSDELWDVPPNGPRHKDVPKVPIDETLVALDPTRVALIIEPRPIPHLPALLSHFISVLPLAWTFRFLGSPASISRVERSPALQSHIGTGKLLISDLPTEYPASTPEQLSSTLTNYTFYAEALDPAEWLFVFQTNSIVCSASELSLDDWVAKEYTWVGAPWNPKQGYGGDGGLSLRYLPTIISLLAETERAPHSAPEDRWLCDGLWQREDANMPPPDISKEFAVESVWAERPLGYHLESGGKLLNKGLWATAEKRRQVLDYCPEIKMILDVDWA